MASGDKEIKENETKTDRSSLIDASQLHASLTLGIKLIIADREILQSAVSILTLDEFESIS